MSEEEFLAGITGSDSDLRLAVEALRSTGHGFCLVGGLAVNHYAEPVVTLDADFAVAAEAGVGEALRARGFAVELFPHSINAQFPGSRLRLQITLNSRYAGFPARALPGRLFGVDIPVAALPDLVQGKLWALQDASCRASKRKKDSADLIRLCENRPDALAYIPSGLIAEVDDLRLKT
ncbi:MAG: nucleotidyl transferase AbiEii/AbiGii toxin family protein [Verrucomicrobiota bacterium]|jgi:hypothetical protein